MLFPTPRPWLLAVVLLILSSPAVAETPEGLLYEVARDHGGRPCYLYGTIHSDDPRVLELSPQVRDAFDGSDLFVMELIPDSKAIIGAMIRMTYTDGRRLADVLSAPLYRKAIEAMAELGMPEAAVLDYKPWALVVLLSAPAGAGGEFLDLALYRQAKEAGKQILGLESIDEQLAVFEGLDESQQVEMLRLTLAAQDHMDDLLGALITAYLAGDLAKLQHISARYPALGSGELGEHFREVAIDRRNHRMAERAAPQLERGGCFVAVGALHLPGEKGLLELLRQRGYQVRAVR